jgi:hypothetical protein
MMKRICTYILLLLVSIPLESIAEDWYVGFTGIQTQGMQGCVIARFKASDGSYTLAQADALYTTLFSAFTGLDAGDVGVSIQTPSQMQAQGYSGEGLLESFKSNGTGVCTSNGQPADAVGFISTFSCDYQNEGQMCFRLYIDAGTNDLSSFGIPSGIATIGGIFVKRELWNVIMSLIMSNGDTLFSSSPEDRSRMLDFLVPNL